MRLAARALGIRRMELGPQGGSVLFEERNQVDPLAVIELIQKFARDYRMEGPLKLRISQTLSQPAKRFAFADMLLGRLRGAGSPPNDTRAR